MQTISNRIFFNISNMNSRLFMSWIKILLPVILAGGLLILVYLILMPFLASVAWAGVMAYITWPAYLRLRIWIGERRTLSALLAVISMGILLILPLLWLIVMVEQELVAEYYIFENYLSRNDHPIPDSITRLPWIGEVLASWLHTHLADRIGLKQHLTQWLTQGAHQLLVLFGEIGRNTVKSAISMITLFFFYRDGEAVLSQIRRVLQSLFGKQIDIYLSAAGQMSKAILLSVILSALIQGIIASLGYWIFDVEAPALLGIATAIASVIPLFGTALIWVPVSIGLLLSGHLWPAVGLVAWGILLIHPADNLIRPLLISNATSMPILLIMFGVLGGMSAFGLIGLFLGPVILAVAIAVWNAWIKSIDGPSDAADCEK